MKSAQHTLAAAALILDAATVSVSVVLHRPRYEPIAATVLLTTLGQEMIRMTAEIAIAKITREKTAGMTDNEVLLLLESATMRCAESALNLLMLVHDRFVKDLSIVPLSEGALAILERFVAETSSVGSVIYPGRVDREAVDELIKLGAIRRDFGMPPAGQPTHTIAI